MCIIVVKPQGISLPTKNILKNCFVNNPDGAGFMYAHKNSVYGKKGFMSFNEFDKATRALKKDFGDLKELPMILHFRIGTSGKNNPGNTHPFPVARDYGKMQALSWKAPIGIAHNGVISPLSYDGDVKRYCVSDTMVFTSRVLAPLNEFKTLTESEELLDIAEVAADSKLAFLDRKGAIKLRGHFEQAYGCLFSNSTYEKITPKKSYKPSLYNYRYAYDNDEYLYSYYDKIDTTDKDEQAAEMNIIVVNEDQFFKNNDDEWITIEKGMGIDAYGDIYQWVAADKLWVRLDHSKEAIRCYELLSEK